MRGSLHAACLYMLHSPAKHVVIITMRKALDQGALPPP